MATLLMNPRKRRKNPASKAQLRARAAFVRNYGGGKKRASNPRKRRRSNPAAIPATMMSPIVMRARPRKSAIVMSNPRRRKHNPRRRRHNPISLGSLGSGKSYVDMLKCGFIGGAGAITVDLVMGQVNRFLPSTLVRVPGAVGVGDLVKAVATIALGKILAKPTRGLSLEGARGALAVQAHAIIAQFLPSGMTMGYAVPARLVPGTGYVGPNDRIIRRGTGMGRYTSASSPLLSGTGRYTSGSSPLLSGRRALMQREGVVR